LCALFSLQVEFLRYRDLNGSFHRFQSPLPAPQNVGSGSFSAVRECLSSAKNGR
jgi:hypothetical protein